MTYTAHVTREGKWWMVSIPEISGLTQARRLSEAQLMSREFIAASLERPIESIDVEVVVDSVDGIDVEERLAEINRTREAAAALDSQAKTETVALARMLADAKVPIRDIGAVLHVSFQRAHQLLNEHSEATGTRPAR